MSKQLPTDIQTWQINPHIDWPPTGRIIPPISPSLYNVMMKCLLKAVFLTSNHYSKRSSPHARLGTAFHESLDSLANLLSEEDRTDRSALRAKAVKEFKKNCTSQRQKAAMSQREKNLPWPDELEQRMEVAIALAADRVLENIRYKGPSKGSAQANTRYSSEETIISTDGMLKGRPDLVLHGDRGDIIIEYKTGTLSDADLVENYDHQCHLYAWLLYDSTGTWPIEYRLINPISNTEISDSINRKKAESLSEHVREIVQQLSTQQPINDQSCPGPHCDFCEFRPWCESYWASIKDNHGDSSPSIPERTRISIQAEVVSIDELAARDADILVQIRNNHRVCKLQVRSDLQPHVKMIRGMQKIRVIDVVPSMIDSSWLKASAWSEIFILVGK